MTTIPEYDHEATRHHIEGRHAICTCGEPVTCVAVGPVYLHDAEILTVSQHRGHVERTSTGSYYAWCSHPECYWHSPRRRSVIEVEEFARNHEAAR